MIEHKETPTLTIITINYNNKSGLQRTLQSVEQVLSTDIEHITVDGASTDGSTQVINDFLARTNYTRAQSEPDTGIYNAMNKGWRISTGKYIAYINSGDEIIPDLYKDFVDFLKTRQDDVCYGRTLIRSEDGTHERTHERHPNNFDRSTLPHPAAAVLRSTMKTSGGFDEQYRIAGDRELFLRLKNKGANFAFYPETISIFYEGGLSSARETRLEDLHISRKYGYVTPTRFHIKKFILKTQELAREITR